MPLDFVRYTPGIETIDPDLDRLLEQIVAFWEKTVRECRWSRVVGERSAARTRRLTAWSKRKSRSCATCRRLTRRGFTLSRATTAR